MEPCKVPILTLLLLAFMLCASGNALAHRPILENPPDRDASQPKGSVLKHPIRILDPTRASLAIYGALRIPEEFDAYYFVAEESATVPIEALVPVRASNANFRPTLVLASPDTGIGSSPNAVNLPFSLPSGYTALILPSPSGERQKFFEPFSSETLYHGNERQVHLTAGKTYYLIIYDPRHYTGDYVIGIGTIENFTGLSFPQVVRGVLAIKLGLFGGRAILWLDIIGLFIFIAGFIIGLGAVTVIDTLGFLGRRSPYWTEATIRAHKVTKPLIWIGLLLAFTGGVILYRRSGPSGVATLQLLIAIPLLINGAFLSFWVSPRLLERERQGRAHEVLPASLQSKIAVSFVISFLGWWSELFLLVYYLIALR